MRKFWWLVLPGLAPVALLPTISSHGGPTSRPNVELAAMGPTAPPAGAATCDTSTPFPSVIPAPVPPDLLSMTLAWVDEFNGTAIDPSRWEDTGLWYAKGDYSPDGHNGDIARPSQVNVSGGNLILSATRRAITVNGVTYPWVDGFVDTSPNDVTPGFRIRAPFYAEVCAKLPPVSPGEWPAIVMYESPVNGATEYAEMDLLERVGVPATAYVAFHPAGSAAGFARQINPAIDLSAAFHTYGISVDPSGNIQYYFDGTKVGAVIPGGTNAMEPMFMSIGMTIGGVPDDGWAGEPMYFTPSPIQMSVAYMRVWR